METERKEHKISIVIADDQKLISEGIRIILDAQPDMEVLAVADNGRAAVELVTEHKPDVALLDIRMPDMDGIAALREIKEELPETVVLMLTTFDPDEYIISAFKSGADGYLLKDTTGEKLIETIRSACNGSITIPVSIASRIIAHIPKSIRRNSLQEYGLTQREIEIAALIANGYNNDKISESLGISMGTTKNYICEIYSKLEVKGRREAICLIKGLGN
ncbi:response regulator transcription factor [Bacillota bacterium]